MPEIELACQQHDYTDIYMSICTYYIIHTEYTCVYICICYNTPVRDISHL